MKKNQKRRKLAVLVGTAVLFSAVMLSCGNMTRKVHKNTGLESGSLNACPDMPNCIGSMYPQDVKHFAAPWTYSCSREEAMYAIKVVLQEEDKVELLTETENYLHASVTIPLFKFVDDVEFYLPEGTQQIHYRSASRVGYSDLGANARRMRKFKERLEAFLKKRALQ